MTELVQDGYGIQAQDINQLLRGSSFAVIEGCEVTSSSENMAVSVSGGTVRFNGNTVPVEANSAVPLDASANNPRKDIIFVNGSGDIQVMAGQPESPQPSEQTHRQTFRPSPPDTANTDAVVLAEVWIPADATDVADADISDRRQLSSQDGQGSIKDSLSVTGWNLIDVSNHGFEGDRSGGDLAQFVADNTSAGTYTVFFLPDGTYDWNRPVRFSGGDGQFMEPIPDGVALIGKPRATLHVDIDASISPRQRIVFDLGSGAAPIQNAIMKNLHIDVGDANEDRDAGIARCNISDEALFENITMSRRHRLDPDNPETEQNGDRYSLVVNCVEDTATATMRRVILSEGDVHVSDNSSTDHCIPIASEGSHIGKNIWEECYVEGFTDNGFYVTGGNGINRIVNCGARNCGSGSFRMGVNDRAENISLWLEEPERPAAGLWIQESRADNFNPGDVRDSPIVIDGFEIFANGESVNDVIRITDNLPEVELKNGYIDNRTDNFVIDDMHDSGKLSINNVTIDDYATGYMRVAAIRFHGDNTVVDNLTYRPHPPDGYNGRSILSIDANRVTIKNSDLHGTDDPIVETHAGADFTIVDTKFPHDESIDDPYLIRNNGTNNVENIVLRHNDFSAYTGGLNISLDDINTHFFIGNLGLTDNLGSSEIRMSDVNGYYDGLLMGGGDDEQAGYSYRSGTGATIYSLGEDDNPGFSFRNHLSDGDMFTVDNQSGDGWFRGGLEVGGNSGLILPDINGGSLPSGTEAGRMVYDSSREE